MKIWNRNYLRLIFFLCGNYGILFFWDKLDKVTYHKEATAFVVTAFVCGLWYVWHQKRKWFTIYVAVTAMILLMSVVVGRNTLLLQLGYLRQALTDEPGLEAQSITFLFILFMVPVSGILFVMEMWWKHHGMVCLILTAMLVAGPMIGVPSSYLSIFLLLFFQVSFAVIQAGRLTGIVATGLFAIAFLIVYPGRERLYQFAYEAEYFVHNTISFVTGAADEATANGQIGKGNDYKTGTVQIELETAALPTENLYLGGFSGGDYLGGAWREDDDTQLLAQAAQTLGWGGRVNLSNRFNGMYFTLNAFLSGEGILNSRSVTLRHPSRHYRRYFSPYGGQWSSDTVLGRWFQNTGYVYRYYEQKDMKIDWNRVTPGAAFETQANWYRNLQDAYMEAVQEQCLQVPRERVPRLTKLCEEHPLTELDEITAFIISALENNVDYTLTPGNAPVNKDIVEYFMFESGKGYCQHFASAAVLMYRLYGIPARYASGYLVKPQDFTLERGMYRAYITDESAHAWVEIFLKDYGWVPIDVTPSTDGSIRTSYPGFDSARLQQVLARQQWTSDTFIPVFEREEVIRESEQAEDAEFVISIPWEKLKKYFPAFVATAECIFFLLPLFWEHRKSMRRRKLEKMDCRQLFARCMEVLDFAGYLQGYTGTEEDFRERLTEQFPEIEIKDIGHMMEVVERAAYGPGHPGEQERLFVKSMYQRMEKAVYQRLKWYHKWRFCFKRYS